MIITLKGKEKPSLPLTHVHNYNSEKGYNMLLRLTFFTHQPLS